MIYLLRFNVFESADYVKELELYVENGTPFAYVNGKVILGKKGDYHSDSDLNYSKGIKYPGRIWVREKFISFWVYPPLKEFKKMIKELENILNIKIFNNG